MRAAVFAYGSLVSPESAAATLGRGRPELHAATLAGWRRGFTLARDNRACEKTFARSDDGTVPDHVLALNLDPGGRDDVVNGALIVVEREELTRLDRRELRYRRVEVEPATAASGVRFDRVFTYVARPAHHAPTPPPGAVVLNSYERTVEAAFAALGPAELRRYRETTDRGTAERIDAHLLAGEIPPGNPRDW